MKHPELKPCPKCGSDNLFYGYRYDCTRVLFPRRWLIACIDCDYESHEDGGEKTRERAMKVHNRRSTMSKERIEEMREMIRTEIAKAVDKGLVTWSEFADYLSDRFVEQGYRKQSDGWWYKIDGFPRHHFCSQCQKGNRSKSNFCPNCGTKMKGV